MKITRRYLKKIIDEETRRISESWEVRFAKPAFFKMKSLASDEFRDLIKGEEKTSVEEAREEIRRAIAESLIGAEFKVRDDLKSSPSYYTDTSQGEEIDLDDEESVSIVSTADTGVGTEQEVSGNVAVDLSDTRPYSGEGGRWKRKLSRFGNNCWRSGQPTLRQLEWLINTHKIKFVIRMNDDQGNDKGANDGGQVFMAQEQALCESMSVGWRFINAHQGYVAGKGYVRSKSIILPILADGDCLIHCRAGADRTGYLVAAFKKEYENVTDLESLWDYTIKFNTWGGRDGHVCEPEGNLGFAKYLDGFYPLPEWCTSTTGNKPSDRKSCPLCKTGLRKLGFKT